MRRDAFYKAGDRTKMEEIFDPPIVEAAAIGSLPTVKRLIAAGANVNVKGQNKLTALRHAIDGSHTEIALELIAAGAKVNLADRRGTTMLMAAVKRDLPEVVEALVLAGADISRRTRSSHVHALGTAAAYGKKKMIRQLVSLGADIKTDGQEALLNAASVDHLKIIKLLMDLGAELDAKEENEYELLRIAVSSAIFKYNVEMLTFFLRHGLWDDLTEEHKKQIIEDAKEHENTIVLELLDLFSFD
ncbi:MAG: ankyrin repeat domain-containing protein [Cyanobacteria bacterium P01_A01_bin.123]